MAAAGWAPGATTTSFTAVLDSISVSRFIEPGAARGVCFFGPLPIGGTNQREAVMSGGWVAAFVVVLSACFLILGACAGGNDDRESSGSASASPTAPGNSSDGGSAAATPTIIAVQGFEEVTVVSGLDQPTNFAFAPDGRIFIAGQQGDVRIVRDGVLLPTAFVELTVNSFKQRGLFGLALDPDFEANGYVYLYFTLEHDAANPSGPKMNRLIRVTADGDVAAPGSEIVLLGSVVGDPSHSFCEDFPSGSDCLPADGCCHVGGGLRFAPDGTIFVATGDGASTIELRFRSQNLDSLAGKMLRINPDGSAPTDNPYFTGDPAANRSKVWAYGLREPFRFGLQPGTALPFIGDVGGLFWEEINIAYPGVNLGWPCYEGQGRHYGAEQYPICETLFLEGPDAVAPPLHTYPNPGNRAVIGGDFALTYPEPYAGAYFFGDWAQSTISYLTVDDDNNLIDVQEFATGAGGPVALKTGPDGEIYYLAWNAGELRHIRWAG
ncbi:MAG: PQQ-dependent sugar dehydrogenase [Chloroflexi bacterium]|nr:PQQ-dependent sugar dehydrogenase [Chloroflexota bacterium]